MGAKTKQVGGGTATPTANNWNQFLNSQLQGGMNQAMNNAQQPGMQQQGFQQALGGALSGQGPADVSGAGDTVVATLAAMMSAGATVREAAALANVAAGCVVAEPGIVAVTPDMLLHAVSE